MLLAHFKFTTLCSIFIFTIILIFTFVKFKQELASVNVTLNEQRYRGDNLKRIKVRTAYFHLFFFSLIPSVKNSSTTWFKVFILTVAYTEYDL